MSPRTRKTASKKATEFVCPDCGRSFTRAAALGSHRSRLHGVAGSSPSAARARRAANGPNGRPTSRGRAATTATVTTGGIDGRKPTARTRGASNSGRARTARAGIAPKAPSRRQNATARPATVNRDDLLRSLFPNGIPARVDAIRRVNDWLDEGERLARLR
jgi:hypothetical protein